MSQVPKFQDGQKVKVDMSGSGDGVVFSTVISSKPGAQRPDYVLEGINYPINEYYIREVKPVDEKYHQLIVEKKYDEFEIDDDEIKRKFWETQKDNVKKTRDFVNFFYQYLVDYGFISSIDEMNHDLYNRAFPTKNHYWLALKHDTFNIIIQHGTTHVTLFITSPCDFWNLDEEDENSPDSAYKSSTNRSGIAIYSFWVEHSDESEQNELLAMTKHIATEFEEGLKKRHYRVWRNPTKCEFHTVLECSNGLHNMYEQELPGWQYTRALFDLGIVRYYFYGWK